jgi:phosphoglycolate phosphatase-like HAD superfamily hydrolase
MTDRIVLFDIDGTLVSTGGAGRRSLIEVFEDLYERADCLDFSFAGMTDRLIMRRALEALGEPERDDTIDRLIDAYIERLADHVAAAEGYVIFDGVHDILDEVTAWERTAVGLGTGNVERGARIKLERAELNPYFDFGGFGCDAAERADLIRAGARRGAERLGRNVSECRVVVVGDTVRDVEAAHAIGAECLAVTTGSASREELDAAGADRSFASLADPKLREALFG